MVQFQETNLIHPWSFFPRMDVIFMRNVLIYFDLETKKNILAEPYVAVEALVAALGA